MGAAIPVRVAHLVRTDDVDVRDALDMFEMACDDNDDRMVGWYSDRLEQLAAVADDQTADEIVRAVRYGQIAVADNIRRAG